MRPNKGAWFSSVSISLHSRWHCVGYRFAWSSGGCCYCSNDSTLFPWHPDLNRWLWLWLRWEAKLNEEVGNKDSHGKALHWKRGDVVRNKRPGVLWSHKWHWTSLKAIEFLKEAVFIKLQGSGISESWHRKIKFNRKSEMWSVFEQLTWY